MGVTGIGGVFFRARDPDTLKAWYRTHLGIVPEGWDPWQQQAGPTVFMPFKATTDYWSTGKQWMLNLRVDNLDGMLATLKAAGVEAVTNAEWDSPETGRFARIHDPEGNPIELWQPPED